MSKILSMSIDNADIAMLTFAMNSAISERKNNASPDAVKAYTDLWRRIQEGIKEVPLSWGNVTINKGGKQDNDINWLAYRAEVAKNVLPAILNRTWAQHDSRQYRSSEDVAIESTIDIAMKIAERLEQRLKGGGKI